MLESFEWKDVGFTTGAGKPILQGITGSIQAGGLLALMGPSGCGKTTLLNCLAKRQQGNVTGHISIDGVEATPSLIQRLASYVPQEDHLIGALTVRETINISALLSIDTKSKAERLERVAALIEAFGLSVCADTMVGTPLLKGISGGQKRRLSVASQLITLPEIVFLDEPTSGLDSVAAYEIISYLSKLAKASRRIIIASIHQPSTATFHLFDSVLLLSRGRTVYHGTTECYEYFKGAGVAIPDRYNPADYLLEITNIDFTHDEGGLTRLIDFWQNSPESYALMDVSGKNPPEIARTYPYYRAGVVKQSLVLLYRLLLKSSRDVIAYGVRLAMYMGLALMMGTVWLRLDTKQDKIEPFINAMFFSSAFMSFMAVAYIPAFLEDRNVLVKERANGLYGVTAFLISNTLIGVPFLFVIATSFALTTYWLIALNPSATSFFRYLLFLFLDLLAAESLVVLICAIVPIFVAALAITAFANGLFMSVGGFLVNPSVLEPVYKYFFYQWDYQRFAFEALMTNEFRGRIYQCAANCHCMYDTPLIGQCQISGEGVLKSLGYGGVNMGLWAALLIVVTIGFRLASWVALHFLAQ